MRGGGLEVYYMSMPPLTRGYGTAIFILTVLMKFSLLNPMAFLLDWKAVQQKFHIWRLFTDYLFLGDFSFSWVFQMYFLVEFSRKLESDESLKPPQSTRGTYLYFLVFQMLALDLLSLILYWPSGRPVLAPALSFAIIYYWSRRNPHQPVGLWGFTLEGYQFPYALLLLNLLMGNSLVSDLMGLATAHLFYVIREVVPLKQNLHFLARTPKIFDDVFGFLDNISLPNPGGSRPTYTPSRGTASRNPSSPTTNPPGGDGSSHSPATAFAGSGYVLGGANTTPQTMETPASESALNAAARRRLDTPQY